MATIKTLAFFLIGGAKSLYVYNFVLARDDGLFVFKRCVCNFRCIFSLNWRHWVYFLKEEVGAAATKYETILLPFANGSSWNPCALFSAQFSILTHLHAAHYIHYIYGNKAAQLLGIGATSTDFIIARSSNVDFLKILAQSRPLSPAGKISDPVTRYMSASNACHVSVNTSSKVSPASIAYLRPILANWTRGLSPDVIAADRWKSGLLLNNDSVGKVMQYIATILISCWQGAPRSCQWNKPARSPCHLSLELDFLVKKSHLKNNRTDTCEYQVLRSAEMRQAWAEWNWKPASLVAFSTLCVFNRDRIRFERVGYIRAVLDLHAGSERWKFKEPAGRHLANLAGAECISSWLQQLCARDLDLKQPPPMHLLSRAQWRHANKSFSIIKHTTYALYTVQKSCGGGVLLI